MPPDLERRLPEILDTCCLAKWISPKAPLKPREIGAVEARTASCSQTSALQDALDDGGPLW